MEIMDNKVPTIFFFQFAKVRTHSNALITLHHYSGVSCWIFLLVVVLCLYTGCCSVFVYMCVGITRIYISMEHFFFLQKGTFHPFVVGSICWVKFP